VRARGAAIVLLLLLPPATVGRAASNPSPLPNAIGVNHEQAVLEWDVVDGARSYRLRLALNADELPSAVFATGITASASARVQYAVTGLKSLTTYVWSVDALDDQGRTLASGGPWRFTTVGSPPLTFRQAVMANYSWLQQLVISLGWLVAGFALFKFLRERQSRATDVLLELDTRSAASGKGYAIVEQHGDLGDYTEIDKLLRFYVLIVSVRQARQVPDTSLSTSFRYGLAHYYHHDCRQFRHYVDQHYPTLKRWLRDDTVWWRRFASRPLTFWRPFFRRLDFWEQDAYSRDIRALQRLDAEANAAAAAANPGGSGGGAKKRS
jgi:hypothetical protein